MSKKANYNPEPHRESVRLMRSRSISVEDIASALNISPSTLRRNHKDDLEHGKLMTDNMVETQLMKLIKLGNARAIHFYLSRRVKAYQQTKIALDDIIMTPPIFSTLPQDVRDIN